MANIGNLQTGIVIDHIKPGKAMELYDALELDKLDCTVAIIKNAPSSKMGRKDILKIEGDTPVKLDILGFIDPQLTVNVIQQGKVVEKKTLHLPQKLVNLVRCKNPRCITTVEQELDQVFLLTDPEKGVYRCRWCEHRYDE